MYKVELDTEEAPNKWGARYDARMKDIAGASHYTQQKKTKAEAMKLVLELMYDCKDVYINYRKKFITIKVDKGQVLMRKELRDFECNWLAEGITKHHSRQGFIYRIPA